MRFNIAQSVQKVHKDLVISAGWSRGNELFTASDDGTIHRWSVNGEPMGQVCQFDDEVVINILRWSPQGGVRRDDDRFVVGCSDGTIRFISAVSGRVEQKVEAHHGAVPALAWNSDGSALATGGEDGIVKIWSATGNLRVPAMHNTGMCVYSVCWNGEGTDLLITAGKDLIVKPREAVQGRHLVWRAHDGIVLQADWCSLSGLIVSGGEDGKYKVWDAYGRNLFASDAAEYPVTSVKFSPDGEMFAVGGFGFLRICDGKGWTLCRESTDIDTAVAEGAASAEGDEGEAKRTAVAERTPVGSALDLAWGWDNSMLAAATSEGRVVFGQMVDRRMEYQDSVAVHTEPMRVVVHNVKTDTQDELVQRDKVVRMSIGYGYIVIATVSQVLVYDASNLNGATPHVFDVKDVIILISLCPTCFMTLDMQSGIRIFDYNGSQVSTLTIPQIRLDSISRSIISLSPDTVCVRDTTDTRHVLFLDVQSGRASVSMPRHVHVMPVVECKINQFGNTADRKCVVIDKNRDMYLVKCQFQVSRGIGQAGHVEVDANGIPILDPTRVRILSPMVSSVSWNNYSDTLVAIADHQLVTWHHPGIVFVDQDLLPKTRVSHPDMQLEVNDTIDNYSGTRVQVRRGADGAMLTYTTSPYPLMLFEHVAHRQWDFALRLCRFVKDPCVWAILAAAAITEGRFDEARDAYSALNDGAKIHYLRYVMQIPSPEGRNAEMALFMRRPKDAEQILVSAGLIYRAIKMYVSLYRWEQALKLALQHKTHVDTVLAFRQKALAKMGKQETHEAFLDLTKELNGEIDEGVIDQKIQQEAEREMQRPGAAPLNPDYAE
eukprot:TRINITY_DN674_c1_g1_i1.p2 TRINITY_DN674_c1_g1~~TRINITY_DN674_c1_g1_i1.p2  ORF type:complete len:830 (+),score=183.64 TRINITY_DN674_c1_g1_i1:144-2633(+)